MSNAKRVGCLHIAACICGGTGFIDDPEQRVALVPDQLPCPGPTEAQYGHIRKAETRAAAEKQGREVGNKQIAAMILENFSSGEEFYQRHKDGGSLARYTAALLDHIKTLTAGSVATVGSLKITTRTFPDNGLEADVIMERDGKAFAAFMVRKNINCVDVNIDHDTMMWVSCDRMIVARISNGVNCRHALDFFGK